MHYFAFLIDDQLDKMNTVDLLSYRERVIKIARNKITPNRSNCVEWMLFDTTLALREIDESLADDLTEGFCALLRAQTAPERASIKHLGPYLEWREVDAGRTFYTALMRFGGNLHLTTTELTQLSGLESCAFRFMGVLNDVYSWDKEWKAHQSNLTDGSLPFSAVYVLAQETGLPYAACKRLMYSYCRELELVFEKSAHNIRQGSQGFPRPEVEKYIKSLEYFMSGVETWSQWTPRYEVS
ncbi:uncharacterized protein N7483_010653 [Penicillium malachiteum]|uniref:uncharacterized protein n=1 Tax=Penicillium malachiteum TaxID=1324776 RepID=UPI00254868E0|nr:uncharacterized protein N7483_010653 [Penicillium malachiteum]KAJ5713472.1 hypothetical protein N7483_010653 [Penicillium malachiteum]